MAKLYAYTFGRIPDELLWDAELSDRACRLYAVLTRYADQWSRRLPEQAELAKLLACSVPSVERAVRELRERGALTSDKQTGEGGRVEWAYALPWEPSPVMANQPSSVRDGVTSEDDANGQVGPAITGDRSNKSRTKTSPNGDGDGIKTDGRADTIVGQAVDALGFRPVEMGAFAKIVTEAAKSVSSPELLLRAVREWGRAGEPISYLANRIGTMDREHRARGQRRAGNGAGPARGTSHDGKHDPSCWCAAKGAAPPPGGVLVALERVGRSPEDVEAELAAELAEARARGLCCQYHSATCEPPSELCCYECPEAAHPEHPEGVACVLAVTPE